MRVQVSIVKIYILVLMNHIF